MKRALPIITAVVVVAGSLLAAGSKAGPPPPRSELIADRGERATLAGPATTVTCGETLTASTKLANDLVNCPGTALVVGADGITVDLNGHTLDGTSTAGSEGIADDGHPGVAIGNGTIKQFRVDGVGLRAAESSTLWRLHIREIGAGRGQRDETAAIAMLGSPDTLVARSRLEDNCLHGVFMRSSPRSWVVANELNRNCLTGVEVWNSDFVYLAANRARDNEGAAMGINVVRHGLVVGNHAEGSFFGFVFSDFRDSVFTLNRMRDNHLALDLFAGDNGSSGNSFVGNAANGNDGGLVFEADGNLIAWNIGNDNASDDPENPGGGIGVFGNGNRLFENVTNQNGGTGLVVFGTANTLTRNVSNANAGHGIEADPATIDGGGNRAHGNAQKPDCIGVVCS